MRNFLYLLSVFFLVIMVITSCGGDELKTEDNEVVKETQKGEVVQLPEEAVKEIIKSIPSPLELTTLIKASGADFNNAILNNPDNSDNYANTYSQALNLGIFGADMGYINIYEKTHISLSYLNAIKGLANELKVGQFFDFATLRRMSNNNSNLDSVIYISTSGFENMDKYLKEKKRGDVSMLILVGGWLEALHIACEVYQPNNNSSKELRERIGEQKIVLDDIILLCSLHQNESRFPELIADLNKLKEAYSKIEINYAYAEPEMQEVDGMLVIVDNSESNVVISDEQVQDIHQLVKQIRNKMIS